MNCIIGKLSPISQNSVQNGYYITHGLVFAAFMIYTIEWKVTTGGGELWSWDCGASQARPRNVAVPGL